MADRYELPCGVSLPSPRSVPFGIGGFGDTLHWRLS